MAMYTAFFLLTILMVHLIPLSKTQCLSDIDEDDITLATRDLVRSNAVFSLNLLNVMETQDQLNPESRGIFFSPYSVWTTLMLTYIGAKGQTDLELRNALGVGRTDKRILLASLRNLINWNDYKSNTDWKPTYEVANGVFFQNGITINQCIYEMMNRVMGFLDFEANQYVSTDIVNEWVERQTNGKIQNLVPHGGISTFTRMVIANAVYFNDIWLSHFDPRKTTRGLFMLTNDTDIEVDMMHVKDQFLYGVSDELQCTGLEMPYSGDELSMLILLPNIRNGGISVLADSLTPSNLQKFYDQLSMKKVMVSLPKFKIENKFELSNSLSEMGIRTLFDPSQADLSELSDSKNLSLSYVYQQAVIDVNEEGTDVSAAAPGSISPRASGFRRPIPFTVNQPFIFIIRDNFSNMILFAGTVKKPPTFDQL